MLVNLYINLLNCNLFFLNLHTKLRILPMKKTIIVIIFFISSIINTINGQIANCSKIKTYLVSNKLFQNKSIFKDSTKNIFTKYTIENGDTIPYFLLKEIIIKYPFKNKRQMRRYYKKMSRLEYYVKKVYPYALLASAKINEINLKLENVKNKKKRREIIKYEYSKLMHDFKKPLSKLSINQGRVLIRLIYRETNNSAFYHIQDFKGKFTAYFWQTIARLFGNNLKSTYDPYGEDCDIEYFVLKLQKSQGKNMLQ